MRQITVLHIGNLSNGGRERRMSQLILGLSERGYYQEIISFSDKIDYLEVPEKGIKVHVVSSIERAKLYREIDKVITDMHPTIVHVWEDMPRYLETIIRLKCKHHFKIIAGFIGSATVVPFFTVSNLAKQLFYLFSSAIVSNTKIGLKSNHAHRYKSHVIYNGFDYRRMNNRSSEAKLREELGIQSRYVVSMVARLSAVKDWDAFIFCAQRAMEDKMDVTFLAVGDGEQLKFFKKKASDLTLNNIIFTGRRNDVEAINAMSTICCLLTHSTKKRGEGISNSILEAMAAGKSVVATLGGGTPEIINNGVNGFMVEHKDSEGTFSIIKQLLQSPQLRENIGKAAKQTIESQFLLSRMTDSYETIYKSIV